MPDFLVESALLTHGLVSVRDAELLEAWSFEAPEEPSIVWLEEGKIVTGGMQQFLSFRNRGDHSRRIDCDFLPQALSESLTGALTASGTMAVCQREEIPLAITCGMGGIGEIKAEKLCPDLPALTEFSVALISAGPKDVVDIEATFDWLAEHGVQVQGINQSHYTGYIFKTCNIYIGEAVKASAITLDRKPGKLIICPIADEQKITDTTMLQQGIAAGAAAEAQAREYHPAANAEFDRLSVGYSSRLQLSALVDNVKLAQEICRFS